MKNRVVSAALGLALAGGSLMAFSAPTAQAAEHYRYCKDAYNAGVPMPIVKGTAVYAANPHLDRDGDGKACEWWADQPSKVKSTSSSTSKPSSSSTSVKWVMAPKGAMYPNCDVVRDAGKAPIYAGEPGYGLWLDRDKDGIGCEQGDPAWDEAPSKGKDMKAVKVMDSKNRGVKADTGVEDADPTLGLALAGAAAAAVAGGVALRRKH